MSSHHPVAQEGLADMDAALALEDGPGAFLNASLGVLPGDHENQNPVSGGAEVHRSETPSSAPSDQGDQERRKRRRDQWERDQADKRRWDLQRRIVDISTDVELLTREAARVHNELHIPLPPLSSLPAYEIQTLEAARARRLTDILSSQCKKTLQSIMAHKWSWPFNSPVDINIYHDYMDTVKTPMDFATVKRRLDNGEYEHPDTFCTDVRLVFDNARAYNKPGSDVHVMATTLKEKFQDKYNASVAPRLAEEASISAAASLAARRRHASATLAAAAGPQREAAESRCAFLVKYLDQVAACVADAKSAAAALCTPLTRKEKEELCTAMGRLPQHHFEAAVGLVLHHHPGLQPYDEIGFDLDMLDALTLRQLQSFIAAAQVAEEQQNRNKGTRGGKDETAQVNWPGLPVGCGLRPFVPARKKKSGDDVAKALEGVASVVAATPDTVMVAPPAQSVAPVAPVPPGSAGDQGAAVVKDKGWGEGTPPLDIDGGRLAPTTENVGRDVELKGVTSPELPALRENNELVEGGAGC